MKTNPVKNKGFDRVLRGGSWNNSVPLLHCTYIDYDTPDYTYSNLGLRLIRVKKGK